MSLKTSGAMILFFDVVLISEFNLAGELEQIRPPPGELGMWAGDGRAVAHRAKLGDLGGQIAINYLILNGSGGALPPIPPTGRTFVRIGYLTSQTNRSVSLKVLPLTLFLGLWVYMSRQTQGGGTA
jgi:hypothetical protein